MSLPLFATEFAGKAQALAASNCPQPSDQATLPLLGRQCGISACAEVRYCGAQAPADNLPMADLGLERKEATTFGWRKVFYSAGSSTCNVKEREAF